MAVVFERVGLGTELSDYEQTLQYQRTVHAQVVAGSRPPTALLLEHRAVFTAGRRTQPTDLPHDDARVIEVDRGGRITWHGPGQLVCYPIVPLPHPLDVVAHVRRLETAIMTTCADFNLPTTTVEGRSGVWRTADELGPDRKVAAIGVRVASGVTMHGLAINVDCDLSWASNIVPCGITDAGVTSIAQELAFLGRAQVPDVVAVADRLEVHLSSVLTVTLALASPGAES